MDFDRKGDKVMIEATSTMTYEGKPIEVLENLIEKRKELLGETTKQAVVATAITVVKSLRADTKIAPKVASKESFIITDTGYVGGWERFGGKFHRVVRASNAHYAPKIANIYPVNLAGQHYEKGEVVKVYKVEPSYDDRMIWNKTKNKGCWYVFAKSIGVVENFAIAHMTRRINSYRGLAKATLGFAMAAISNNGNYASEVTSKKSIVAAANAAQVYHNGSIDEGYTITIDDLLSYSALALKSGKGAVNRAMQKAANSIAGRLKKVAGSKLNAPIQTPFPEVRG